MSDSTKGTENQPIEITKNITWQENFQKKIEAAHKIKDAAQVLFYEQALQEKVPGPAWEMFQKSFAYKYWIEDNQSKVDALQQLLGQPPIMEIFEVIATASGEEIDTVYVQGINLSDAKERFKKVTGDIPESMMTWNKVDKLPKDEEFFAC